MAAVVHNMVIAGKKAVMGLRNLILALMKSERGPRGRCAGPRVPIFLVVGPGIHFAVNRSTRTSSSATASKGRVHRVLDTSRCTPFASSARCWDARRRQRDSKTKNTSSRTRDLERVGTCPVSHRAA
eukprot:3224836-Prymnesium_polylepis.1